MPFNPSHRLLAAALMLSFAAPAMARENSQPASPANAAADVHEQPETRALNANVHAKLEQQAAITAEQQAQYDLDRAAYRAAVTSSARQMTRDMVRYDRQQDAYARAMIQWREQTAECKRGILKSCKKPTPLPSSFY